MADSNKNGSENKLNIRYMGRFGQAGVIFGKLLRVFIFQSDWITIPMAALIAGLVSIALGQDFGKTKEGTLMGVFALVCVCLWNGTFNSIQIICRERDVVKREHRSGMYISSYIMAHMMHQALICAIQCIVTLVTAYFVGMTIEGAGLFTDYLVVDVGLTLFLVTYAADMLALFISAVVRSTTIAMTIMPFVLIFQMVFSGGLFPLPSNISFISVTTVSSPGFDALASLMDTDNLSMKAMDDMFKALEDAEMDVQLKGSDIINMLANENDDNIKQIRAIRVGANMTLKEACDALLNDDKFSGLRKKTVIESFTVGDVLDEVAKSNDKRITDLKAITLEGCTTPGQAIDYILTDDSLANVRNGEVLEGISLGLILNSVKYISEAIDPVKDGLNTQLSASINVGELIDFLRTNENFSYLNNIELMGDTSFGEALGLLMSTDKFKSSLDTDISYYTTVGDVIDYLNNTEAGDEYKNIDISYHVKVADVLDMVGRDKIHDIIENSSTSQLLANSYVHSKRNVFVDWLHLFLLILVNSIAAIIALSFIDKDKR